MRSAAGSRCAAASLAGGRRASCSLEGVPRSGAAREPPRVELDSRACRKNGRRRARLSQPMQKKRDADMNTFFYRAGEPDSLIAVLRHFLTFL